MPQSQRNQMENMVKQIFLCKQRPFTDSAPSLGQRRQSLLKGAGRNDRLMPPVVQLWLLQNLKNTRMDTQVTFSPSPTQVEEQTPGAGPSRPRVPHAIPQVCPQSSAEGPRAQAATYTGAVQQEVELGVYLTPDFGNLPSSPSGGAFPRRGSNGSGMLILANTHDNIIDISDV